MKSRLVLVFMLAISALAAAKPAATVGAPLYPDLRTSRPFGLYFDTVWMSDGLLHYVLRFSNTTWNGGEGRLELQGDPNPSGSNQIYQNLYDAPTGGNLVSHKQISSDIYYHPSHYHYHFENFASYLLLKRDSAGVYQQTTKKGTKTSFCVFDYVRMTTTGPSYGQYTTCSGSLQGLSVGWGDTYESHLPEQWVDLGTTRLADGYYALQSTADPFNKINEGGRDGNNIGTTYFSVTNGAITIGTAPAPTTPACSLSATSGLVGSTASLNCSGFAAGETVRAYWDSTATTPLASAVVSSTGSAGLTITIPDAVLGIHRVIAVGSSSSRMAAATYTVSPRLLRTPTQGEPGTSVTVTVKGYGANESVRLTWDSATGPILGTATTNGVGTGTTTITIPQATAGWHDYTGVGLTTGARAWGAINVLTPTTSAATLSLSASSAQVGNVVSASGAGFFPGEIIHLYWDSTGTTPLTTATASATGTVSLSFAVPDAVHGTHRSVAKGASSSREASATLTVTPRLLRTPIEGTTGTSVMVTVKGYGANEAVALTWDSATGPVLGTATTNAVGTGTATVTIPQAGTGWHNYTGLGLTTGARGWGAIKVLPGLTLSPTSATVGATVSAALTGYPVSAPVTVYWNRTATSGGTAVCGGTLSASGSYTCSFRVPSGVTSGTSYPVVAVSGTTSAQSSLAVTASTAPTPTSTPTPTPTSTPTPTPTPTPTSTPTAAPAPTFTLSHGEGAPGTTVTASGARFGAGERVRISWDTTRGRDLLTTVYADTRGEIVASFTVPASATPGSHVVIARGANSGYLVEAPFNVVQPQAAVAAVDAEPTANESGDQALLEEIDAANPAPVIAEVPTEEAAPNPPSATGTVILLDATGLNAGVVTLGTTPEGLMSVALTVQGLAEGVYEVRLADAGSCADPSAGHSQALLLGTISSSADASATLELTTDLFTLAGLLDGDGSSLAIYAIPDHGSWFACGNVAAGP